MKKLKDFGMAAWLMLKMIGVFLLVVGGISFLVWLDKVRFVF